MRHVLIGLCGLLLPTGGAVPVVAGSADRPNIVLILADDLGFGDLACYGHAVHQTPHLDRLAAEGVRLTGLRVATPYCAPSRGTILTGRYPWRHGVWDNPSPDGGVNDVGLPAAETTIAEALQTAGYATACIGKWHLGHRPEFFPRRHGFDEYFGILYSNDMRPVQLLANEQVVEYPVVQATLTQRYTDKAVEFIDRNRDRPFFLYLAHAMPHKPLAASEQFYRRTGNGLYSDVIHELDAGVGAVWRRLDELQLDERTLIIFTSDNGPWFGGSTAGLRGMKSTSWEGGLRVPGIVRWPGRIPGGQVLTAPCGTIDLFPTLLAAAEAPLPADHHVDGVNLLPWLQPQQELPDRPLFAMNGERIVSVQRGRFKLHVVGSRAAPLERHFDNPDAWVDNRGPDGVTILAPVEQSRPHEFPGLRTGVASRDGLLFDLENDPAEQHDVAADHPDVVRRLTADFRREAQTLPAPLRSANSIE